MLEEMQTCMVVYMGGGGMRFGTRNAEGERVLEFGDAVGMAVYNIFFKKEDSMLISYQSGDNR